MLQDILFLILGLAGLFIGGEWLVTGASRLARSFGISALVVGLTVVAFGTSMPELLVSLSAALNDTEAISIGNVVGSNVANIGLILSLTALIFPISVHVTLLRREIPILLGVTIISYLLWLDGIIGRLDGIVLVIGLVVFNAVLIYLSHRNPNDDVTAKTAAQINEEEREPPIPVDRRLWEFGRLLAGLVILGVGANWTVSGSISVARAIGVSELVIGITLVAVGTSLPELATSVIAATRQQSDIAIGNVVGSNIYNLLGILGITAIVRPIHVDPEVLRFEGPIMLGFTFLMLPFVANRVLSRLEGTLLLSAYVAFIAWTLLA
jgi:cation:H+ antiporter